MQGSLPHKIVSALATMTLAAVTVVQMAVPTPAFALDNSWSRPTDSVNVNASSQTRYEAENGTFQGTVDSDWPGYSGTGFVNTTNAVGAFASVTVNAAVADTATLVFDFANGTTANRPMNIFVNGVLASSAQPFQPTGAFSTWSTSTVVVSLAAGTNTIRAVATTANGGPNLDFLDVVTGLTPLNQYEAEDATISQGLAESDHTGFTALGFVNYDNVVGSFVQFSVNATQAGQTALRMRFANGTTANRPMNIFVNGSLAVANVAFNGTGAWTNWVSINLTVNLNTGSNTIRATATTANGGPNLDHIAAG